MPEIASAAFILVVYFTGLAMGRWLTRMDFDRHTHPDVIAEVRRQRDMAELDAAFWRGLYTDAADREVADA